MNLPPSHRWRVTVLDGGRWFYAYPRRTQSGEPYGAALFASHPAAVRYACRGAYLNYLYTRKGAMRP